MLTRNLEGAVAARGCDTCKRLLEELLTLRNFTLEYLSCHEAGHAFARIKNGDTVLLIDARERFVTFRTPDWKCDCGAFLKMNGDSGCDFNFNPDCKSCDAHVTDLLTANYIGVAATANLMLTEHDPQDGECDYAAAAEFMAAYRNAPEKWEALKHAAAKKADELVKANATAILKLRDAIVAAGGHLEGTRAHEIVSSDSPGR